MFIRPQYNPVWGVSERLSIPEVDRLGNPLLQRVADVLRSHYAAASQFVLGRRVLDMACGTGYGARMLLDAGAASVVGCDLSENTLVFAREEQRGSDITFVQGDAQRFTWQQQFDVVCSFETIEHLEHPLQLLDRVGELLAPDGVFCLSVPLGATRHLDAFHQSEFSEVEIREALASRGFYVESASSQDITFRGRDLLRLGELMPETRPTWADLLLTRRGWRFIAALIAGCGRIRFRQYFAIARRID